MNPSAALELPERDLDLGPGRLPRGLVELGEHLVQRAERLPLELGALGGRGEPERGVDPLHLHLAEACLLEEVARFVAEKGPGRPGPAATAPAFRRMIEIGTEKKRLCSGSEKTIAA